MFCLVIFGLLQSLLMLFAFICCIFAVIAAHLNIHKIVQGSDRLTVDFFHGFMVSVEICSRWIFV